jgi:hypothetical protein
MSARPDGGIDRPKSERQDRKKPAGDQRDAGDQPKPEA